MKKENEFDDPKVLAKIKEAHDKFVAKLKTMPMGEGAIEDHGDDPAERATIERWATDPEARKRDLERMGALEK